MAIIQYNGNQTEEHLVEIKLVILGQPIQSSIDQENYFPIKCNLKSAIWKCLLERSHIKTDSIKMPYQEENFDKSLKSTHRESAYLCIHCNRGFT